MAESIFAHLVAEHGCGDRIKVDGAGTGHWHIGEPPDRRTILELERNGIRWMSNARQVQASDFEEFDYILAMDEQNRRDLLRLGAPREKVRLILSFDPDADYDEVPDPYYGTQRDFTKVYQMLYPACEALLKEILAQSAA